MGIGFMVSVVQEAHRLNVRRVDNKDAPVYHRKDKNCVLDEPLIGFGLICDLLFAMALTANCNFTIVHGFRVGFPKMKWAEENPKSCLTWRLDFDHFIFLEIKYIYISFRTLYYTVCILFSI